LHNNNNNNTQEYDIYSAVIMTEVNARVHSVHSGEWGAAPSRRWPSINQSINQRKT